MGKEKISGTRAFKNVLLAGSIASMTLGVDNWQDADYLGTIQGTGAKAVQELENHRNWFLALGGGVWVLNLLIQEGATVKPAEPKDKPQFPTFDEIAGQDRAVAEAKSLVLSIKNPEALMKRGAKRPKGILFFGPPGNGKTILARAIAQETGAVFIDVTCSDIRTKWYGQSEKNMADVFTKAATSAQGGNQVIIFFDEIDALGRERTASWDASASIVSVMLQNMDGIRAHPNVTFIAATNRLEIVDDALLRPGRFDRLIEVGLPDQTGRKAILQVHINKALQRSGFPTELFEENMDLDKIVQATDGASGADLEFIINKTILIKTEAEAQGGEWRPITAEDLLGTVTLLQNGNHHSH
ncbi:ATP-binding protein [Candidatus Microgenomates bacterium]|nr:ATP-binding protein [Candidatus Microgenomates bacterium]